MAAVHHEPLLRIVKRGETPFKLKMLVRLIAVLLALVVDAMFIFFVTGLNPFSVYTTMFQGTFSTPMRFSWALRDLASLLLIGIALAPAFKMRFWNIGAEGQVLMGALATAAVMAYYGGKVPAPLLYTAMLIAAVFAGALWGFVPAWFKAKLGTNETLFTLMMNYVATYVVSYFLVIWVPSGSSSLGKMKFGKLPPLPFGNQYLLIILIVLLLTGLLYIYLRYSKHGYEISVVGESVRTAQYSGMNVSKVIIRTMVVSGLLCGLAGYLIGAGLDQSITTESVGGQGFTAIMVSWLANFNPLVMLLTSGLIALLNQGAAQISQDFNVSGALPDVIVGIILFFIIGSEFFINYQVILRKKGHAAGKEGIK